jgi:hypothetical protein
LRPLIFTGRMTQTGRVPVLHKTSICHIAGKMDP